jgi:4-hydroxybenzoyl-CoA thioesterase
VNDGLENLEPVYEFDVEWGDCDPADIVYYPNYYRWFDNASHRLFLDAGFGLASLREQHESLGFPLVDACATFRAPAKVGDRLRIYSQVSAIGRKSITVEHRVWCGDTLLVEGREVRIMGVRGGDGALKAVAIPEGFRSHFGFSERSG